MRERLLEQKLYDNVTKGAKATNAEVAAYYAQNITQYQVAASRKVEEILVGKNKETLANQLYAQLKAGANCCARKKYSQGPGLQEHRRQVHRQRGSDVPEFDAAVFSASQTGVLIKPVKTAQYGWFVIGEPLATIPHPRRRRLSRRQRRRSASSSTTKQQAAAPNVVDRDPEELLQRQDRPTRAVTRPRQIRAQRSAAPNPTTT